MTCKHQGERRVAVKITCKKQTHFVMSYSCDLHWRCLPGLNRKALRTWREMKPESEIYKACCECTNYEHPLPNQPGQSLALAMPEV